MLTERKLVLVVRKTRLQELKEKYCTIEQARFYLQHLGDSFEKYEDEHQRFELVFNQVQQQLKQVGRLQILERSLLPTYLFNPDDIVVVLGQDGLVANTLKYLNGQPLMAINPLPDLFDGMLLPFRAKDLRTALPALLADRLSSRSITFAQATTNLGDSIVAVNDFFIGPRSHTSGRYRISVGQHSEEQSSSGVIVSTGLGSTGWFRSILAGASAIAEQPLHAELQQGFAWDSQFLYYSVREPFPSATSSCNQVFGKIDSQYPLQLSSRMPENGVIFSDGIEQDAIAFNAGTIAEIKLSQRQGNLVMR